ncbi:MAG: chromate transporter [Burkholderiaceae bacterium]|jgi:chromate transporter
MESDSATAPLWDMCAHLALISMMAIGGGVVMLAPDIHRYVVEAHHWISSEQFAAAYTLAQAAPGPNMLYVTLVGWWVAGWQGALAATLAIVVPPVALTLVLMRASERRQSVGRFGTAVKYGLAPVSVGLLLAGGWVLMQAADPNWRGVVLTVLTVVLATQTKVNPIWLIGAGAIVGVLHWV